MNFAERYIFSKLKTSEISFEPKSFEHPAPNGLEEMSRILKDLSDKNITFEDYQEVLADLDSLETTGRTG